MKRILAAALCLAATPLWAADIAVDDAYGRTSRPGAPTGAIFMTIVNTGETPDRLVAAASPAARVVELHTHIEEDGVMKMRPIEGGIELAAGESRILQRGGDHVMLMGITETLDDGDVIPLVLTFEEAGEIALDVVVDNDREQGHGTAHGN